ncbi:TorF family putative porin [Sphingomonas morindae]|uniref:TorF family putative porin n=1 Tax=Sphingomonas morindae TaxID=1541170 RepID=A0ABY4X8I2_9SPHN|nr:TorF family putative porin [Sphingomonas morindae]USI73246.1 TorF family putative porin [Sphingomonas morindae]
MIARARLHLCLASVLSILSGAAAHAQAAPKAFTLSGSAALTTDYRFRGVSQSDGDPAIQGGITLSHQSGVYAGFWGSNLAGWGTFGGPNLELDLVGGFKKTLGSATVDLGLTWYTYPGGADKTDFAEPYVKLSGTRGPLTLLAGIAYAPPQQALGRWYETGADAEAGEYTKPGDKEDNLYLWGDAALAVPGTRLTGKAHLGRSKGNKGLGPNGTSVTPTGEYWDWLIGVDYAVYGPVTLSLAYIDTDISDRDRAYLLPNFAVQNGGDKGKTIAGSKIVFTVGASF